MWSDRPSSAIGLPVISGWEAELQELYRSTPPSSFSSDINPTHVTGTFACALHMHQPTIPAAEGLISNLQHMLNHPQEGDNHNAETFLWCYRRMGEWIPELVAQGCQPRIMLDYSGNLLWGLEQMGQTTALDALKRLACDRQYALNVEWLGTMWSHAVVPSTPIADIKLQVQAWQHQFVALFGPEALQRVKGFSLPEMHLPNHPDTLYHFLDVLLSCGYEWLLVQEHSVERLDGSPLHQADKYVPNALVARNSQGQTLQMPVLIKTQGSDTKLVAQMQPYHEAQYLGQQPWLSAIHPPCVSQIADGENGGVMMNEYARDFHPVWHQIKDNGRSHPGVVGLNGTEYLNLIRHQGFTVQDFPQCQAVQQHKIWQRVDLEKPSSTAVEAAIQQLKDTDPHFSLDGASWTNHLSWVQGYENVLGPMEDLSKRFHHVYDPLVAANPQVTQRSDYQEALLYTLLLQTSCFRYWGQGTWTDYAQQLYDRGLAALNPAET
ncbi:glycosyl hydrolase family 57 [Candidatus Synechococcus calcipolaris]|uniref:glycosyl hydrolase family 57 n=1 Tax=Candidatus Synechococcus calcipolaris TaxID=1522304 RepID=UPI003BAA90EE